jgi:hypothetical protein
LQLAEFLEESVIDVEVLRLGSFYNLPSFAACWLFQKKSVKTFVADSEKSLQLAEFVRRNESSRRKV